MLCQPTTPAGQVGRRPARLLAILSLISIITGGTLAYQAPQLHHELSKSFVQLVKNNSHSSNSVTSHLKSDTSNESNYQKRNLFEKVCIGTSNRFSGQHNKTDHYQNLAARYRNCTYIIGNLEITWLERSFDSKPLDLTFLESIREITGYLLIAYVEVDKIRMPNLQIIRGRDLFKFNKGGDEEFAMLLMDNKIKTLELPNLREIIAGSVGLYNNPNLCYMNTIDWDEILQNSKFINVLDSTPTECPRCDESCQKGACWGEGVEMCQKFSKRYCAHQCDKGRCFGDGPRECCHLFCAGGCTGPKQTDCFACKNFYNDGECIEECPPMRRYNPNKFSWEANPNGRYAFGATCVKECPDHLLRDNGACVRTCPPDKRSQGGECVPCLTDPCQKNCTGVETVNSGNINQLVNCTVIEGSITILDTSFTGYTEVHSNGTFGTRYLPMHPSQLETLNSIREITGFLNIQASHPNFRNLNFLRNLELIGGRQTTDYFCSLSIIKTSLVSLNLRSLKNVRAGRVLIEENPDLCFADTIDWQQLNITKREDITTRNNAEPGRCIKRGLKCNEQCARDGCWGSGQDECLSCRNHKVDDYCVENCGSTQSIGFLSFDAGNQTCKRCHPECRGGCSGTEASNCWRCKNVKDGPYCVAECPDLKYNRNGICENCDKSCKSGCTGPANKLGEGGCNSCDKAIITSTEPTLIAHCIRAEEPCPYGYYQEYVSPLADGLLKRLSGKPVCRKCSHKCKSCTGIGTHVSVCECAKFRVGEQCEDSCPRDYYADEQNRRCNRCSPECNGCFGPSEADCINCRVYRIYHADSTAVMASAQETASARIAPAGSDINKSDSIQQQQARFNCTAQCPPEKPHRNSGGNMLDPYCSEKPIFDAQHNPKPTTFGYIFILVAIVAIAFCILVYKCQVENDKRYKLTYQLSGIDDQETIIPSNEKANLRQIRSIKETELRKSRELGAGFGGRVYMGQWYPEEGSDKYIAVAIKVLRDNKMNKEFLDEAYIMASAEHKNLVRLLGICMTPSSLMLITPLMVPGCLLQYVREHKNNIGSKRLLEWCKQIANGMAYLEKRRMVHRDLALRNVLLQTAGKAMISDFGLAKLLELGETEYHTSDGGLLPIKWLAPECVTDKIFTHKSDVWAFGVTVWELLTFGGIPFPEFETKDVPEKIQQGARLEQPTHVSAEVYKIMYSCWFPDPEVRPDFQSLAKNFADFAKDPERYLALGSRGRDDELRHEFARGSESDDNGFDEFQSVNSFTEADFFDSNKTTEGELAMHLRRHSPHDSSQTGLIPSTPTFMIPSLQGNHQLLDEDVFTRPNPIRQHSIRQTTGGFDLNNNANGFGAADRFEINTDSCSSMHHTMSTNSIGQKSEQKTFETDQDDYLLPSPITNEDKFKFLMSHETATSSKLPPAPPFTRDPPHSAGLIGISNEEYFMTRINYVSTGPHGANNASSGHIPSSLV